MNFFSMARLALALMLACTSVARGQTQAAAAQTILQQKTVAAPQRALIVLVEKLADPSARATVIRRPVGVLTQDIILVTRSTRPTDLAKAISTLIFSRNKQGVHVSREMRAFVSGNPKQSPLPTADERRASGDLARLSKAGIVNVEGVGRGRAIAVALAPARPQRTPR